MATEQMKPTQPIQKLAEQTNLSWIDDELDELNQNTQFKGERLPALKLETGKVTTFTVDLTVPFGTWTGQQSGKDVTKSMIPVVHKEERKLLWVNKKNPLYREMMEKIKAGQTKFKVSTTGSQSDTRYTLVEED